VSNFSAISWREQATLRWDNDDVHFVLDNDDVHFVLDNDDVHFVLDQHTFVGFL
jgi:hypothetical protein